MPPLRLLLFGSPAVLLGVVAWAALDWAIESVVAARSRPQPIVPVFRFVNSGSNRDGTSQPTAIVWQTSTALEDCADVVDRRNREEKKRIADLMSLEANSPLESEDGNACAPFQLGEVVEGSKVEVLDEYGQMAKVRMLSGTLDGRVGYIQSGRLGEAEARDPGRRLRRLREAGGS